MKDSFARLVTAGKRSRSCGTALVCLVGERLVPGSRTSGSPNSPIRGDGAAIKFENGGELRYPANSNYEEAAGRSYRSGKNGGMGVPSGRGAAVDAVVGGSMASGWNGLL